MQWLDRFKLHGADPAICKIQGSRSDSILFCVVALKFVDLQVFFHKLASALGTNEPLLVFTRWVSIWVCLYLWMASICFLVKFNWESNCLTWLIISSHCCMAVPFSDCLPLYWCRFGDSGFSVQSIWISGAWEQWRDCGVCLHSL